MRIVHEVNAMYATLVIFFFNRLILRCGGSPSHISIQFNSNLILVQYTSDEQKTHSLKET